LERGENKIIKFNRFGKPERRFGDYESGEGELIEPQQIDILQNKFLVISDASSSSILLFDFFGTYLRTLLVPGLKKPAGICSLPDGRMLVCDPESGHIWIWEQNLAEAQPIHFPPQLSIKHPRDAAVYTTDNALRLYIIDSDRVVFGYLR